MDWAYEENPSCNPRHRIYYDSDPFECIDDEDEDDDSQVTPPVRVGVAWNSPRIREANGIHEEDTSDSDPTGETRLTGKSLRRFEKKQESGER